MADESETLTFERTVAASPAEVYRAFTSSTALREWLCDTATTSPRANGHLFVGWNDGYYATGHFTELLQNRAVCFTWPVSYTHLDVYKRQGLDRLAA